MTGNELLEQALRLLHYTDGEGCPDRLQNAELMRLGMSAINQVIADLWYMENEGVFSPLQSLNDTVPLSMRAVTDAAPYGVAMFLAQSEGDGDSQSLFARLYNQKRGAADKKVVRRLDIMPT